MLPSLISSFQRVTITNTRGTASTLLARHLSSQFPGVPPLSRDASPDQLARAKELITSTANPRSRRYNNKNNNITTREEDNKSKRTFPTFRGIPTKPQNEREPTQTPGGLTLYPSKRRYDTGVSPADMPFLHHHRHDFKAKPKFKNPRKRASKLYNELMMEKILESKASKPEVWEVPFKVGDAVELEVLDEGGVDNPQNKPYEKIRGVVLGRHNRGLDTAIYLKDVLYGEHVERKVKLHSPMVKTLKVLEEGFVYRGKKKGKRIKRAKLYYLRDRKPEETRVSAPQK